MALRRNIRSKGSVRALRLVLFTLFLSILPWVVSAAAAAPAVPATFLRELLLPGSEHFLRPAGLCVDRNHDEILVSDAGNNRIVIYDTQGVYRHEFSGSGYFSSPAQVQVDSEGFIYVCGGTTAGRRLFRFDFDGLFLGEIPIDYYPEGRQMAIGAMIVDENDRICILDRLAHRVCLYDREGGFEGAFPVLPNLNDSDREGQILGGIAVSGDRIFVALSTLGTVKVFDHDGEFLHSIGYRGNNVGELNFPVALALSEAGHLLILDKHRFNVVCYTVEGRLLGEFGGRGSSPGWFYHPTLLGIDKKEQVYIGQVFQNKIQVCALPGFASGAIDTEAKLGEQGLGILAPTNKVRWDDRTQKEGTPEDKHFEISTQNNVNLFEHRHAMLGGM